MAGELPLGEAYVSLSIKGDLKSMLEKHRTALVQLDQQGQRLSTSQQAQVEAARQAYGRLTAGVQQQAAAGQRAAQAMQAHAAATARAEAQAQTYAGASTRAARAVESQAAAQRHLAEAQARSGRAAVLASGGLATAASAGVAGVAAAQAQQAGRAGGGAALAAGAVGVTGVAAAQAAERQRGGGGPAPAPAVGPGGGRKTMLVGAGAAPVAPPGPGASLGEEIGQLRQSVQLAQQRARYLASPEGVQGLRLQAQLQERLTAAQGRARYGELVASQGRFAAMMQVQVEKATALQQRLQGIGQISAGVFAAGTAGIISMAAAADPKAFNSLKESVQNLAVSLGGTFAPVLNTIAAGLQNVTAWFNGLDAPTKSFIGRLATVGVASAGLVYAGTKMVGLYKSLADAAGMAGKAMTLASAHPILATVALVGTVATLASAWASVSKTAAQAAQDQDHANRLGPRPQDDLSIERLGEMIPGVEGHRFRERYQEAKRLPQAERINEQRKAIADFAEHTAKGLQAARDEGGGGMTADDRARHAAELEQHYRGSISRHISRAPVTETDQDADLSQLTDEQRSRVDAGRKVNWMSAGTVGTGSWDYTDAERKALREQIAAEIKNRGLAEDVEQARRFADRMMRSGKQFTGEGLRDLRAEKVEGRTKAWTEVNDFAQNLLQRFKTESAPTGPPFQSRFMSYSEYGDSLKLASVKADDPQVKAQLETLQANKELLTEVRGLRADLRPAPSPFAI